jgi:hypothetical protein
MGVPGVRQKKQHKQEDYAFSQNQYEDYLTLNGIVNRTGIAKEIPIRNNLLYIVVRNFNESNKVVFSKAKLDSIFNLSKFTSANVDCSGSVEAHWVML